MEQQTVTNEDEPEKGATTDMLGYRMVAYNQGWYRSCGQQYLGS
jgi:hypothetical protein